MRILLVEDNADLAANVAEYLGNRGDSVDFARDGVAGLQLAVSHEYDAVVLDVALPGLDGVELCRRLRDEAGSTVPLLMLTARDTVDDKVVGLEAGADDYMVKPFALRELAARLNVITRRRRRPGRRLQVADLRFDVDTCIVRRGGKALDLTPTELRLLEELMRASPAVLSRDALEHALWGDTRPESDALRLHVHGLRRAIDGGFVTRLLHTVRGRGWALREADEDAV